MKIRERDGCLCQVPGCSRPAMHAHHKKFYGARIPRGVEQVEMVG